MGTDTLEPITRLSRDLKLAARNLSIDEVRYLVDSYYQLQEVRKGSANQIRSMLETKEPCEVLTWFAQNAESLESQIKRALESYCEGNRVGRWSMSNVGIGPVISAGLLAHIDMEPWRCHYAGSGANFKVCKPDEPHGTECGPRPTKYVGQIWRFAGLDPTQRWEKGQKRPWNADLKTLCWKIGESFLKNKGREKCFYGVLLEQRWNHEKTRNDRNEFKDQAAEHLRRFNIGKTTDAYAAYSQGKLPPAHILQRSKRFATKIFLSHWHHVSHAVKFGRDPEKPFVWEHMGHTDIIPPPNWPCD